jgi:hypothetical protein
MCSGLGGRCPLNAARGGGPLGQNLAVVTTSDTAPIGRPNDKVMAHPGHGAPPSAMASAAVAGQSCGAAGRWQPLQSRRTAPVWEMSSTPR